MRRHYAKLIACAVLFVAGCGGASTPVPSAGSAESASDSAPPGPTSPHGVSSVAVLDGIVEDSSGRPIVSALVLVNPDSRDGAIRGVAPQTDSAGRFTMLVE